MSKNQLALGSQMGQRSRDNAPATKFPQSDFEVAHFDPAHVADYQPIWIREDIQ
jgi:hypothetical protein